MFSAAKVVVAGAIVAVFGGLLLAGVLTTQPSDETPQAGASASPELAPVDRVRLPSELPESIRTGSLDTPLGPARWAYAQDGPGRVDWWVVPLPAPNGFVALDARGWEPGRLWRSPDLVEWTAEPVDIEGFGDGDRARMSLAGDRYWLRQGDELWRSDDTVTWQRMDTSGIVSPLPEWLREGWNIGDPVASGGSTLVPLEFKSVVSGSDLGLPDLRGDWRLESEDPGVYVATVRTSGSVRGSPVARLRFEETENGLRVIDADDDTASAELQGVGIDLIDLIVAHGPRRYVHGLARVEGDRLVPLAAPQVVSHERELIGNPDGFVLMGRSPDGSRFDFWSSSDGATWSAAEPLGDDPLEPVSELNKRHNTVDHRLYHSDDRQWTTPDGITWQENGYPERLRSSEWEQMSTRVASSWLLLSEDGLSFKSDDGDEWATVDVTELGIGPVVDRWLTEHVEEEFGIDSFEGATRITAISSDTIAVTVGVDGPGFGPADTWIITFDDVP